MSRVGKKPILFENDIKISQSMGKFLVEGPNGKIELSMPKELEGKISGSTVEVSEKSGNSHKNLQGLF